MRTEEGSGENSHDDYSGTAAPRMDTKEPFEPGAVSMSEI
jgi:hypothetical protein